MEPYALDLSLEVVQSSTHNLGDLTLWCRLRANTYNPMRPRPNLVTVYRRPESWSPPICIEPHVDPNQIDALVAQLRAMNWPGRSLQLGAVETPLTGTQELRLRVELDGLQSDLRLTLFYGGMTGPDAGALTAVLRSTAALAGLPNQDAWLLGTWSQG
jgi:hypothetical protein